MSEYLDGLGWIDVRTPGRVQLDTTVRAIRGMEKKLAEAIRAAWIAGKDFQHGPAQVADPPFTLADGRLPPDAWQLSIVCTGGPCERLPDGSLPVMSGWSYYPRPDFTEGELQRFKDGRHDWRDGDWQDHCGLPGCEVCTGDMPGPHGSL